MRLRPLAALVIFVCGSVAEAQQLAIGAPLEELPAGVDASFSCQRRLASSDSQQILQSVQSAYSATETLEAQFAQESSMAALDTVETASGVVKFRKPGLMRWTYSFPEEQVFLVRDETVWLYQPQQSQLVVDSLKDVVLSDVPVAFLMGLGNLARDFELETACDNGAYLLLSLQPRKAEQNQVTDRGLQAFDLLVSKGTLLPAGARVVDVGGNSTAIRLSAISTEPSRVTRDDFEADFPKGIDVTDRRDRHARAPESLISGEIAWAA